MQQAIRFQLSELFSVGNRPSSSLKMKTLISSQEMRCLLSIRPLMKTNFFEGQVKVKILLLYSTVRPDGFSSTLQPYPWQGIHPYLGVSHHLEVIRADGQLTSNAGLAPSICPPYVFASPNFTPWYGEVSQ